MMRPFLQSSSGKAAAGLQKWRAVSVESKARMKPRRSRSRSHSRGRSDSRGRSPSRSTSHGQSSWPERSQPSPQPGKMFIPGVHCCTLAEIHTYFSSRWGPCLVEQPYGKGFAYLTFADGANMPEPKTKHTVAAGKEAVHVRQHHQASAKLDPNVDSYGSIAPEGQLQAKRSLSRSYSRSLSRSRSASRSRRTGFDRPPERSERSLQHGKRFTPSLNGCTLAELHAYFSSRWGACMIEQPRGKHCAYITFADGTNMPKLAVILCSARSSQMRWCPWQSIPVRTQR